MNTGLSLLGGYSEIVGDNHEPIYSFTKYKGGKSRDVCGAQLGDTISPRVEMALKPWLVRHRQNDHRLAGTQEESEQKRSWWSVAKWDSDSGVHIIPAQLVECLLLSLLLKASWSS